jgi:hypothetical protein
MASVEHGSEQARQEQDVRLVVDAIPTLAWSARAPPVIVQGTHSRHLLERFTARILRWMRDVDVSEHSISPC